jgi:hypothetical protein
VAYIIVHGATVVGHRTRNIRQAVDLCRLGAVTLLAAASEPTDPVATPLPPMSFTFSDLDGLMALDEPQLDDLPCHDAMTTAWSSIDSVTDAYLVVKDVPATLPVGSAEGAITMTPLIAPSGHAWLAVDNGVSAPPPSSATHIMSWRDDDRLWIISSCGMAPDQMTDLTLAIEQQDDGELTLPNPSSVTSA